MDALLPLTWVDIAALLLIGTGGIQGFFRGLSGELARLVGVVVAFVAGTLLYEPVGLWVSEVTRLEPRPAQALVFILSVLLALLIMILIRVFFTKAIKLVFAEGFDKAAGVCVGLLRMGIFVCLFFMLMQMVPVDALRECFGERSLLGRFIVGYVPTVERTLEKAGVPVFRNGNGPED